jgi:UDP-glucose 4-epimerase
LKKVLLLTGASGFIGSFLYRYFVAQNNWEIIRVDRSQGFDLAVPGWSQTLPDREVDVIIHLAQSSHYRDFPDWAQDIYQVNVASTFELLEWARRQRVKRLVFASTGTVYAAGLSPLDESSPCAASSMYAATKLSAEYLLEPYSEFFEIVIARLFGIYGPGQRQRLVANLIDKVVQGEEIQLAAGVGIYLTPLFIDDCVKILATLAQTPLRERSVLLNVAGDESLHLAAIVAAIAAHTDKTPVIRRTDEQPKYFATDNARLKTYYHEPLVPFEQGIALTIKKLREDLRGL